MGLKIIVGCFVGMLAAIGVLVWLVGYWPAEQQPADASAVWTEIYAIGSLLQLIGVSAAALFAYRAWKEAKRSADTAESEAKKNGETVRRAQRAYLSLREYKVSLDATRFRVEFRLEIPNGGATPAYDVKISTRAKVCAEAQAATLAADDPDDAVFMVLQNNCMRYRFHIDVPKEEWADVASGHRTVGGSVLITYLDVFRDERHTLQCRMITFEDDDGQIIVKPCGVDEAT